MKLLKYSIGIFAVLFLFGCTSQVDTSELEKDISNVKETAELAMATGSMWMTEHHLHEIEEALEKDPVDWEEAEEETEELIEWLEGATWPSSTHSAVEELVSSAKALVGPIESKNVGTATAAQEDSEAKYKQLHHEVMEAVVGGKGHGDEGHHD